MTIDERRKRLIGWLATIKGDVEDLILDHHVFWEVQEVIRENPRFLKSSGLFNEWLASGFVHSAMIGVRRHAKTGGDSISLKRFLEEVKRYPELVSRQHYLAFFAGAPAWQVDSIGNGHFDKVAGSNGAQIDLAIVDGQLANLQQAVASIEHYVDRRVAHYDKRGISQPMPTFSDLEGALKTLEQTVIFYVTLLEGKGRAELRPTISYHWQDVFEFAWRPRPDTDKNDFGA